MADDDAAERSRTTPPQPLPSAQPLSSLVAQRTTSAGAATTSTATAAVTRDAVQHEALTLRMSPARSSRYGGGLADLCRPHVENFGSSCGVGEGGGDDNDDDGVASRRTLAPRQDSDRHSRWHRIGRGGDVSERSRSRRQGAASHGPDQDGPLDFSVKRRGSVSESFTDESRASSSVSPTSFPGATPASCSSPRVSPPSDGIFALQHHHQRQQQQQHFPATSQHQGAAARRGRLSCSEELELVGQPRTAPPGTAEGSRSTSPSAASAGRALSNGAHGKSAAALLSQNGAMVSPLNSLSGAFMMDPRRVAGANGGKVQRPFKAYPKELLQMPLGYLGHPTLNPLLGLDPSVLSLSQEELMAIYWQQLDFVKERDKHILTPGKTGGGSPPSSNSSSTSSSNGSSNHSHNHSHNHVNGNTGGSGVPAPSVGSNHSHSSLTKDTSPQPPPPPLLAPPSLSLPSPQYTPNFVPSPSNSSSKTPSPTSVFGTGSGVHQFPPPSAPPLVSSTSSGSGSSGSRKRPRSLPDSQKDDAYWERRRKNNDAAKRSRDARRAKEDEIAIRAALLEQENLKLRVEVAALKTETARLRCMLYNS